MTARIALACMLMTAAAGAERYAVLVANSSAGPQYERLRYTGNDIRRMEHALTAYCGFDSSRIVRVVNAQPRELDRVLERLRDSLAAGRGGSVALFYYSGHAREGKLLMGSDEYDLTRLRAHLGAFPAAVRVGILDACQSGGYARLKGGALAEPFVFAPESRTEGEVLLYSSAEREYAQESDAYRGSVFTFHFVNALRGCGDQSGDGKVTVTEAYQYAYHQTVASTVHSSAGPQHPGYRFNIQGEGDVVLADVTARTSGVVLEGGLEGGVTILDKSRNLVAELSKEQGSRIMIALSPGAYTLVNHRGGSVFDGRIAVEDGRVLTVDGAALRPARMPQSYTKGQTAAPQAGVHLKLRGGYRLLDFAELDAALERHFAGYGYFGLRPTFAMPNDWHEGWGTGSAELCVSTKHGIAGFGGIDYLRISHDIPYTIARVNPIDGARYGGTLQIADTLRMMTVRMGSGYFLTRTVLRNLGFVAGIEITKLHLYVASSLYDSLFDVEAQGSDGYTALAAAPFAGVSYSRRLWRALSAGVDVRYRFRRNPVILHETYDYYGGGPYYYPVSSEPREELRCGIQGLDAMLYLMVSIGPGWSR